MIEPEVSKPIKNYSLLTSKWKKKPKSDKRFVGIISS